MSFERRKTIFSQGISTEKDQQCGVEFCEQSFNGARSNKVYSRRSLRCTQVASYTRRTARTGRAVRSTWLGRALCKHAHKSRLALRRCAPLFCGTIPVLSCVLFDSGSSFVLQLLWIGGCLFVLLPRAVLRGRGVVGVGYGYVCWYSRECCQRYDG